MTSFDTDGKQDYTTFFTLIEENSGIFYELLGKEDGITCLLEEYQVHELNEKALPSDNFYTELFGCQFIRCYAHHITESEFMLKVTLSRKKRNYIQHWTIQNCIIWICQNQKLPPARKRAASEPIICGRKRYGKKRTG